MITVLTFLPVATAILILLVMRRSDPRSVRLVALCGSLAALGFALAILGAFDPSVAGYQPRLTESVSWVPSFGISYKVGIDGISLFLVVLTAFLTPICVLASWRSISTRVLEFHVLLLLLETGMLGVFVAMDLVLFYVFWEAVLIPMYFLIGVWGSGNRLYAAVKFVVYTMVGSLLMLLAILYVYHHASKHGAPTFDMEAIRTALRSAPLPHTAQVALFLAFFLSFAIKVPLFPLHTWLPDAHTEAPTAGSVVLAGVLLKMGTYGFVRLAIPLFPEAAVGAASWIAVLAVAGIVVGALLCMVQEDMKRLVAYSSVSHMGFVMLGIFAMNASGVIGGTLQMVNHGLSTGALFLLVGMLYERRHTRRISDYGGLASTMPLFATAFLVTSLSSIGLPGLNGFPGEFLVLLGGFRWSAPFGAAAATGVVLGAAYMLVLCRRLLFGGPSGAQGASGSTGASARPDPAPMGAADATGASGARDSPGRAAGGAHSGSASAERDLASGGLGSPNLHAKDLDSRDVDSSDLHSRDLDSRELWILVPMAMAMVFIGLFSPWLTDRISPSVMAWLDQLSRVARSN